MPFNREYELAGDAYETIINRTRTGPPTPPSTGTTVVEAGNVVADSTTVAIRPSKTIKVTMPGPREPVLNASGIMAPRWRRFFEELYRRTGALEDNVNGLADKDLGGSGLTPDALALAGKIPTLARSWAMRPGTAGTTIAGNLVYVNTALPLTASTALAGSVPTLLLSPVFPLTASITIDGQLADTDP